MEWETTRKYTEKLEDDSIQNIQSNIWPEGRPKMDQMGNEHIGNVL